MYKITNTIMTRFGRKYSAEERQKAKIFQFFSLLFVYHTLSHQLSISCTVFQFWLQKRQDSVNAVGGTKTSEDELTCSVCLEQVNVGELIRSLPCLHQVFIFIPSFLPNKWFLIFHIENSGIWFFVIITCRGFILFVFFESRLQSLFP